MTTWIDGIRDPRAVPDYTIDRVDVRGVVTRHVGACDGPYRAACIAIDAVDRSGVAEVAAVSPTGRRRPVLRVGTLRLYEGPRVDTNLTVARPDGRGLRGDSRDAGEGAIVRMPAREMDAWIGLGVREAFQNQAGGHDPRAALPFPCATNVEGFTRLGTARSYAMWAGARAVLALAFLLEK